MAAETGNYVRATHREIAVRFRLSGTHAARRKAKRLGWEPEAAIHPAHPFRIRVPREAWDQADAIGGRRRAGERSTQGALEPPNAGTRDIQSLERVIDRLRRRLEGHAGMALHEFAS
jgi:hypothetical protein